MRSKLFVPASRPELFAKALGSEADALSFDLEDAVAPERKPQARAALLSLLQAPPPGMSRKTIIVRVNALDTPHFAADLAAVVRDGLHLVNLPKPDGADEVRAAAAAVAAAARANGVAVAPGLLLNIETPRALRLAHELAAAHPGVAGLQLGLGDLFEPLGIDRKDSAAVRQVMLAVRLAAGEAGVFALDAAYADIADEAGFVAEAQQARRLGFIGKSCIHPKQVALANAAFLPQADEIAHARRVVAAARRARADGVGAFVVDGRMVDAPFVRRAEAVLGTPAPVLVVPEDACDCHIHVYDGRFATPIPGTAIVPRATADHYLRLQARLGTGRTVVVTPAAYRTDNGVTVDAIAALGREQTRGIAVLDSGVSDATLEELDAGGIRGIRFTLFNPATAVTRFDMIEPLAARVARLGWHVQLHLLPAQIVEHRALLERLPAVIVFDHMARLATPTGIELAAFDIVAGLIEAGRTWVKLSGAYFGGIAPDYAAATSLARQFVRLAPERMVWGSDWPHPTETDKPDDAALIDLLLHWTPDPALQRRILVDNPAALYGFAR
jgi:citrate lyase subunit beta/citryl-CoA lyase